MDSFVGNVQLLSDETVVTMNSTALVTYPIRTVMLNVLAGRRQWFICNGHRLVRSPPVC